VKNKKKIFNQVVQFALPGLTIGGQIVTALKHPEFGLVINLAAQPFWLYSSWKAYRQAGQIGIFTTAVIFTVVTAVGVVNYWFL